jgi:hypothetical protein
LAVKAAVEKSWCLCSFLSYRNSRPSTRPVIQIWLTIGNDVRQYECGRRDGDGWPHIC